jgi:ABC-type uncharacterized transport system ATPase subunit
MVDGKKEKEVFKPNINGSSEQRRMEAQKRKDLADGHVFATVNGVTEMHPLSNVVIHVKVGDDVFDGTVSQFVTSMVNANEAVSKELQRFKESVDERFSELEIARSID